MRHWPAHFAVAHKAALANDMLRYRPKSLSIKSMRRRSAVLRQATVDLMTARMVCALGVVRMPEDTGFSVFIRGFRAKLKNGAAA